MKNRYMNLMGTEYNTRDEECHSIYMYRKCIYLSRERKQIPSGHSVVEKTKSQTTVYKHSIEK